MRRLPIAALIAAAFASGIAAATLLRSEAGRIERIVAMSWRNDGFYGAQVYLEPVDNGYRVRARVHIGRGNGYFHDCGILGETSLETEAVARWGAIRWEPEGLRIGKDYFLPRQTLESHR